MPNQNQWSVFKRLLTYLKPYKFLTFLALTFLLSTTIIKSIIPLVASYFIDHYLHDMNQAASLILIFVTLSPFRSEGAKQINHPLCGCASKVKPS